MWTSCWWWRCHRFSNCLGVHAVPRGHIKYRNWIGMVSTTSLNIIPVHICWCFLKSWHLWKNYHSVQMLTDSSLNTGANRQVLPLTFSNTGSWEMVCALQTFFSLLFSHNTNINTVAKFCGAPSFLWQKWTAFSSWLIRKRPNWKIFTLVSFPGSWYTEGICSLF